MRFTFITSVLLSLAVISQALPRAIGTRLDIVKKDSESSITVGKPSLVYRNEENNDDVVVADGFRVRPRTVVSHVSKMRSRDNNDGDHIEVSDGFRLRTRDDGEDEGVVVADGFKLKARDDTDDETALANGFKLKARDDDSDDGVVVADGF